MNQVVVVHGAGDDLVVIAGPVQEEFLAYDDDQGVVTFSDGTVLHVKLVGDCWDIEILNVGPSTVQIVDAPARTGAASAPGIPDYSARATVVGPSTWVEVNDDGGRGPRRVPL